MMRTRKANKKKNFKYSETYQLGSDESDEELDAGQDPDEDNDFDETEARRQGQDASDGDDEVDTVITVNAELAGRDEAGPLGRPGRDGAQDGDGESMDVDSGDGDSAESGDEDTAPRVRGPYGTILPKRIAVHEVGPYPSSLQQTRVYEGLLKKHTRGQRLLNILYGPHPEHLSIVNQMLRKWLASQTLPKKQAGAGVMQSPWLAGDHEEKQKHWSKTWYGRYQATGKDVQRLQKVKPDHIAMFRPPSGELVCLAGPFDNQKQSRTTYGLGRPVSDTGKPQELNDPAAQSPTTPKAWLLDTGGIPLAIGWAPLVGPREQFLAVCTVPYSDQEYKDANSPEERPDARRNGSVQIWSIPCHKDEGSHARAVHHISFDGGRAKRMQWCPVPPPDDSKIGLLAILCGDGQVKVLEVPRATSDQNNYDWVESPVATLGLPNEGDVKVTCLTWVNINRICLGHSDGSISLWSIYPRHMINRHPVHTSQILDIASAFPSHPYHIATVPVGGSPTLTDLGLPSAETTYIPLTSCVNFQPNLLDWNDHLQGYFSLQPSAAAHNTIIGWSHVRHFVESRTMMTAESMPMCVASGRTHPFTLVGCADGRLWAFNPLRVLLRTRGHPPQKLRVLQHEFRAPGKLPRAAAAAGGDVRGAARILQGFTPEFNMNPRAEVLEQIEREKIAKAKAIAKGRYKGKVKGKGKKVAVKKAPGPEGNGDDKGLGMGEDDVNEDGLKRSQEVALLHQLDLSRAVVHEARTRITVAAWNPNVEYGWWAAAAMGSGLVKVMDLGIGD